MESLEIKNSKEPSEKEIIKSELKNLAQNADNMPLDEIRKKLEKLITDIADLEEEITACETCGTDLMGSVEKYPMCQQKTGFSRPANKGVA